MRGERSAERGRNNKARAQKYIPQGARASQKAAGKKKDCCCRRRGTSFARSSSHKRHITHGSSTSEVPHLYGLCSIRDLPYPAMACENTFRARNAFFTSLRNTKKALRVHCFLAPSRDTTKYSTLYKAFSTGSMIPSFNTIVDVFVFYLTANTPGQSQISPETADC